MDESYPIIDKLGGPDAVFEHLRRGALIEHRDTINQWRRRRRIPGYVMRELMELAELRSIPYQAADFRVKETLSRPKE